MTISNSRLEEILKKKQYDDFMKFMEGQTVIEPGVFDDDFIRWVKKLPVID